MVKFCFCCDIYGYDVYGRCCDIYGSLRHLWEAFGHLWEFVIFMGVVTFMGRTLVVTKEKKSKEQDLQVDIIPRRSKLLLWIVIAGG